MKKAVAEKHREIDFSRAKRGAVVKPEPGKTKISIRLDNTVIEFLRALGGTKIANTLRPGKTISRRTSCSSTR